MIFFPAKEYYKAPQELNIDEVSFKTDDGETLHAWWMNNHPGKRTVLFFHGNGGNIYYGAERMETFNNLGLNALAIDYRSYGKSSGEIKAENDLSLDSNAAFKYLLETKNISEENIIIWGWSLGGAVTTDLAQNKNIDRVIVEATFYELKEMSSLDNWALPIETLLKYPFKSCDKINNIKVPVMVIHSREDDMISFSQGKKLFNKLESNDKVFVETVGSHNARLVDLGDDYLSNIEKFINK